MKPINGEVVSSKPLSLTEAASILSAFISKGTGATREASAYLARTCATFNELVEYHQHVEKRSGASVIKEEEKEIEKYPLKGVNKEAFDAQDETNQLAARSVSNGHVKVKHESERTEERSRKEKEWKHREHEVDLGTLAGPARSKLDAMQSANGAEDDGNAVDHGERDRKKKKRKRDRQEGGGVSQIGICDGELEHPPKKKKAKGKVVEYETEVERILQYN